MHRFAAFAAACALFSPLFAQTIPYFPLGSSDLALRGPARPGAYVSAVGRNAIAMGTENGQLEMWSWPVKWLHDFQLSFRIPKYTEPIPGRDIARSVTVRPEGFTIEYAYESFTVREHVFVPLDKPAVVILLEVDALRPMEIVATFVPDIHFAWPAGLGGQYLVWSDEEHAVLFSESKRSINAFLGSPAVTQASDVPAHMLAAAPPQLVLGVGGERYTPPRLGEPPGKSVDLHVAYIPIVIAGGAMPRDAALALYRQLLAPGAAENEWKRRVAHAEELRQTAIALHSPDPLLDKAVEWAKINLDDAYVCNPDLGCGLVAGYGLSGSSSDRPGFGWFFGGDAAINSLAMTASGLAPLVRDGVLRFFAKYQRADGKIPHEISQGAGHIDWFSYPYAFYHGDTTPFWIVACGKYWRQTGDTALLRELWPNLKRAFEWSKKTDTNGDGLMDNPAAGAGAIEVGDLQKAIQSDVYLSGVWIAALDRFARMAEAMGEPALAEEARSIRARAMQTLESKLWMPAAKQYAFALLEDGSVNENLTAWPATAMAFRVLDPRRGAEMAAKLASSEIMTDWGARPLSAASSLFDPLHYNNGAVWPFVTGFVSLAQYRYHNPAAGWFALQAIVHTGCDFSAGHNPEVLSGRLYAPLDTAVPQQFFATSMVLSPLIHGLLGIDVDVPAHRITIAPQLPPEWDEVEVDNVPVGTGRMSIAIQRTSNTITATVHVPSPIDVVFSPALPLGAHVGPPPSAVRVTTSSTLTVHYSRGWSIIPPSMPATPGTRSRAPRVISERLVDGRYTVTLEGLAGQEYAFRVRGPDVDRSENVTFPAAGANADGYTSSTITEGRPKQ